MSKFPWKTTLAGLAIAATTVYAVAQHGGMHGQMMQGQGAPGGMHGQMMQGGRHGDSAGHHSGIQPTSPGQDAFGAIQEIVQILDADPSTDWSKINIGALREHLIDMNEVTLRAAASERMTDTGIEIAVTGEGRTRDAIKRMVPAHARELAAHGWNAATAERADGVTLTVAANDKASLVKLKALGFMGIMAQGGHHQPHHLMMAKGGFPH